MDITFASLYAGHFFVGLIGCVLDSMGLASASLAARGVERRHESFNFGSVLACDPRVDYGINFVVRPAAGAKTDLDGLGEHTVCHGGVDAACGFEAQPLF